MSVPIDCVNVMHKNKMMIRMDDLDIRLQRVLGSYAVK